MRRTPAYPFIAWALLPIWIAGGQARVLKPLSSASESLRILRSEALEARLNGQDEQALDAYERALSLARREFGDSSSYLSDLYFEMGTYAFETSKFERAETYLMSAVKLNPNSVTARVKLSELLRLRNRPEDAAMQASQALLKHPNSIQARQALALAYLDMNDLARANRAFYVLDEVQRGKAAPPPAPPPAVAPQPPPEEKPAVASVLSPLKALTKSVARTEEKPARKAEPGKKPKAEAKPAPPARKPQPRPKPEKPRPATREVKPKAAAPALKPEAPKGESKPVGLKAKPAELKAKPAKPPRGLVPPPPPVVPSYVVAPPPPPYGAPSGLGVTTGNPGYSLKTEVKMKPKEKPKEQAKEDKAAPPASSGGSDDDFLLDWFDKGGKKKGK